MRANDNQPGDQTDSIYGQLAIFLSTETMFSDI